MLLRPIYLYVGSFGKMTAKIYAMGNPVVFWTGVASVFSAYFWAFKQKNRKLGLILFGYLTFFVSWAVSPRIMFLYHYLPSIPFMSIAMGYILAKYPKAIAPVFIFAFLSFVYFYPHWTGIQIPLWLDESYYWFRSWR